MDTEFSKFRTLSLELLQNFTVCSQVAKSCCLPIVYALSGVNDLFIHSPARGWTYKLGGGVGVRLGECWCSRACLIL